MLLLSAQTYAKRRLSCWRREEEMAGSLVGTFFIAYSRQLPITTWGKDVRNAPRET
jgi:hypothetical protein